MRSTAPYVRMPDRLSSLCISARSLRGDTPNLREYSRLNWVGLSYPTSSATLEIDWVPSFNKRRASFNRRFFWYCNGLVAVRLLKCSWKVDELMPEIWARSGTEICVLNSCLIRLIAFVIRLAGLSWCRSCLSIAPWLARKSLKWCCQKKIELGFKLA